jgi:pimeloyl-ACP methyl ester carboxylesterase
MEVKAFKIEVHDKVLDDLRRRLETVRWPDQIPNSGWDYGSNLDYLKELVEYWRSGFDWRAQEAKLNDFHHFKSQVDGLDVHFIHERGKGPNPLPLVITHGWPSTFFEMHKIIPLLADPGAHGSDPADAFDVVAPSLPGFGFSDQPTERGMDVQRVAGMWNKLMTENLGYRRFAVQGGDIGAGVTSRLGNDHAGSVIGIHLTSVNRPTPYLGPGSRELTEAEQSHIAQRERWQRDEGAYNHLQSTKPQTLSYGLNDSPVGLAAWIVEKYRTWSDCGGEVERRFTKDELLTNITIYWVTQTIGSSVRMYYDNQRGTWEMGKDEQVPAPAAVAVFPGEISRPPKEWADRSYNVCRWTEMASGGHFAALEEPVLLAEDIRAFFRSYRSG